MKFVEGISVDRLISEDSNLNRGLKLYIYQNIEKELNLWHSMGFVHGDLFLRNVMISKEGKIWLIDPILYFGETGNFKEQIRNRDLKELAIIKNILTRI
jgi:RIO-like serine/threonine protein kinase